jgi:hypothetical protein
MMPTSMQHAAGQTLTLDLRMLSQGQGYQLITGEGEKVCVVHAFP